MAERVLLIPLDDRPVTRELPAQLAAVASFELVTPPREICGSLSRAGDPEAIGRWLLKEAYDAVGLVVSLDTVLFGGLMQSRRGNESLESLVQRLDVLRRLKERHPDLPVYAFSVITRLSRHANPDEERFYWKEYGEALFDYSLVAHQAKVGQASAQALADAEKRMPREVLNDYLKLRERNHKLNKLAVNGAGEGLFHRLFLTADDNSGWGLNVLEQEHLQAMINLNGWDDRVMIYPGADEVASLLVARLIGEQVGFTPSFYPFFAWPEGDKVLTMYEGVPLAETVSRQVAALGGIIATSPEESDCQLFINGPQAQGGDVYLGIDLPADQEAIDAEFLDRLGFCLSMGNPVAVADVAWANGAQDAFVRQLVERSDPTKWVAFAGWNTAGNTLGSVLAHASLRLLALETTKNAPATLEAQEKAHLALLFERLVDDWLFQGKERPVWGGPNAPLHALQAAVEADAQALFDQAFRGKVAARSTPRGTTHYFRVGPLQRLEVSFPWNRPFEIALDADFDLEALVE